MIIDPVNNFYDGMRFRGSFSYKNDNIYVVTFNNNIHMRIERMDTNVARLYFVGGNGNQIPIPKGITLRDTLNNTPSRPVAGNFFISWISDYSLFQNGVEICALKNQKQQSVEGVDGFTYTVIET
ncbi:hypothetical protein C2G38_2037343 [Gigaspora rosea]|uniref:Uncharacterized protein n=1 Tax=Gigaspora rosea TaxID=44941 RepID=A0A397V5Q0_9GLOM|nr:hypothetical protein C2G38_2037343 [Gigaspora rosea]CAG8607647.1 14361_t:CDS:1 [Gigaspora rosea]